MNYASHLWKYLPVFGIFFIEWWLFLGNFRRSPEIWFPSDCFLSDFCSAFALTFVPNHTARPKIDFVDGNSLLNYYAWSRKSLSERKSFIFRKRKTFIFSFYWLILMNFTHFCFGNWIEWILLYEWILL